MEKLSFEEIYQKLITKSEELKHLDSSLFNYKAYKELLENNLKLILEYKDNYNNDYIQSIYENNELYSFYSEKIQATNLQSEEGISNLKIKNREEIVKLVEEHQSNTGLTIQKYKAQENDFKPKITFLHNNKKLNKEEYIKNITDLNRKRLKANHRYEDVANDLVMKNEQVQFDFKHAEERFTDKNNQDSTKLQSKMKESAANLNLHFDDEAKNLDLKLKQLDKITADKTATLNQEITKLSNEFERRKKFGFIPYDMEHNKVLDRIEDENKLYSMTEENILNEFKEKLQFIDNELEKYRNKKREMEDNFKELCSAKTKEFHQEFNSRLVAFEKSIKHYEKLNNLDKDKSLKLKNLLKEKKRFIKDEKKKFYLEMDELKKKFFLEISEYIDIIERLRSKKLRYEAVKSNAMKCLNAERDYMQSKHTSEINIINKKKEFFLNIEHFDENKRVLEIRLPHDLEMDKFAFNKSEYEREKHKKENDRKYESNVLRFQNAYQRDLLRINLDYQNKVLSCRINHANVTNLLEIQKARLIKDYQLLFLESENEHESLKLDFYNDCDKIQYDLYKLNRDYFNKELDEEINLSEKLFNIHKQGVISLEEHEIRKLENINMLKTSKDRVLLHTKRFEIEKGILNTTYLFFANAFNKILEIENNLLTNILKLDLSSFNSIRGTIIHSFTYLRELKLDLLNDYYDNEVKIINSRINFEKDLKYRNILDNLAKDKEKALNQRQARKDKFIETITSYQNTISLFEKQILEYDVRRLTEKNKLKALRKEHLPSAIKERKKAEIKKNIFQINEKIQTVLVQINANERNIYELNNLLDLVNSNLKKVANKYDMQINEVNAVQKKEAKDYYETINLIKNQYLKIKDLINLNSAEVNNQKFVYSRLTKIYLKINSYNGQIAGVFRDLFNNHFNKLCTAFSRQIQNLRRSFVKSYEKNRFEINQSRTNEINSNKAKVTAIYNEHNATILAMSRTHDSEEKRLYQNLKALNDNFEIVSDKHRADLLSLEENLDDSLLVQEENLKLYDTNYQDETNDLANLYETNIRNAKKKLNRNLKNLALDYKRYNKMNKNRIVSNELVLKNKDHEAYSDFRTNMDHYTTRSKETLKEARFITKKQYNLNQNNLYNSFRGQQQKDHEDFKNTLIDLNERLKVRIKNQIKDYKKNLWK